MQSQKQSNPTRQQSGRANRGKPPKINKKGEIVLSLADLNRIAINLPPGFAEAGNSLVIIIRATGTEVGLTTTPPILDPIDDANRLFAAKRTIAGVEAQEKKTTSMAVQKSVLMRELINGTINDLSKVPAKFSTELARLAAASGFLEAHAEMINTVHEEGHNKALKAFIQSQIRRIYDSITTYMVGIMRGEDVNHATIMRNNGVSSWIFNKLTASTVGITSTMALEDFFFGKKAEKGLTLTVQELREAMILKEYEFLLSRSHLLVEVVNSDKFGPAISGIDTLNLDDETNNEVKRILRMPVYITPVTNVRAYAHNHDSALKIPGEPNLLNQLSVQLFALVSGAFPFDMAPKESIQKYFGIVVSSSLTKSLREDFVEKLKPDTKSFLDTGANVQKFASSWLVHFPYLNTFIAKVDYKLPDYVPKAVKKVDHYPFFERLSQAEIKIAESEKFATVRKALDSRFEVRVRRVRNATSKSRLHPDSRELIATLEEDKEYVPLLEGIVSYLTSFSNKGMQGSAARIMHAEYDKKTVLLNPSDEDEEETYQISF